MHPYFQKTTSAAPLALFRVALGLLLFGSTVRFWAKGWIDQLYIQPKFFFTFYGFEFVQPLGEYTYVLFAICAVSALMVALGMFYRISATALFLSFSYIELIDKSTYLNHYYFISMICLMMIFLPAHVYFSFDTWRKKSPTPTTIPLWCADAIKLFVCILYFYAGLAKINADWLLNAQPLRIWLPAKNDIPVIGFIFNYTWVAYAFSWIGCLYDLSIPFLLFNKQTRSYAYVAVIVFHCLTSMLFPIGMFPYIMIVTALIFFPPAFHQSIIDRLRSLFGLSPESHHAALVFTPRTSKILITGFAIFFIIQLALPFRYVLYPGNLFWTEEGFRFSWRVMLMEKAGYAQFTIKDREGKTAMADNTMFLTTLQEKMMATQPDMILQYAHMLKAYYAQQGFNSPQVYVNSYVALNGRRSKLLIDPSIDLAKENESFSHKSWILPLEHDVKGF